MVSALVTLPCGAKSTCPSVATQVASRALCPLGASDEADVVNKPPGSRDLTAVTPGQIETPEADQTEQLNLAAKR